MQRHLRDSTLYQRLRASRVYDAYWRIARPAVIAHRDAEVAFYRRALSHFRSGDLIFDVGANHGYKVDIFLRLGAKVVAVDPDVLNQRILAQKFHRLRLSKPPVEIVGKALGAEQGVHTMWLDTPGSAKNTLSEKWVDALRDDRSRFGEALSFSQRAEVETTTLDHLIAAYGRPSFVKIDVEGYEVEVLRGLTTPVPMLSFEVNLPDFREEGCECASMLATLDPLSEFNYGTDLARGFLAPRWLSGEEMLAVLARSDAPSLEVFCRTISPTIEVGAS